MKVYIGKHTYYFGPYQLAGALKFFGLSEAKVFAAGEWLEPTWVGRFLNWVHTKRDRTVLVHIDDYDTWSMDHTLAYLILPMLKQLKATKHGAPMVDDEDVPEALRSTSAPPKKDEYDVDDNHFKRWDWVLDEMIWAFGCILDLDDTKQFFDHSEAKEGMSVEEQIKCMKMDKEGLHRHEARKDNAFLLFGKYYRALWD